MLRWRRRSALGVGRLRLRSALAAALPRTTWLCHEDSPVVVFGNNLNLV